MAQSPAHKLGQQIGDIVEELIEPRLRELTADRNLFLDRIGVRPARRGKKLSWYDKHENKHDLDYVIEKNGSANKVGAPVAFIEVAWRRYKKHSKNKAQEIQGALLPIAEKYYDTAPFLGVVLAGEFTEPSKEQLRTSGFSVLHFAYDKMVDVFSEFSIDVDMGEDASEASIGVAVEAINNLEGDQLKALKSSILKTHDDEISDFFSTLKSALERQVLEVIVLPLFGTDAGFSTVPEAKEFLQAQNFGSGEKPFQLFRLTVQYSNGDKIEAEFRDIQSAIKFLDFVSESS